MRKVWRDQKGAALVEYALVFTTLVLVTLGTLEILRLILIQQSLRTALRQVAPCYTHWKDEDYRTRYTIAANEANNRCDRGGIKNHLANVVNGSLFRPNLEPGDFRIEDPQVVEGLNYGERFWIGVEVDVPYAFFIFPSWIWRDASLQMAARVHTFVDSAPEYIKLNKDTAFPSDRGGY